MRDDTFPTEGRPSKPWLAEIVALNERRATQSLERFITDSPGAIRDYLDANWGNWRLGEPCTDLILYPSPIGPPLMIGPADPQRGFLVVDGERFYSAAWL